MDGSLGPRGALSLKRIRGQRPTKLRRFLAWLLRH